MVQELEKIEYRKGMLDKGMKPKGLPVKVWRGAKIPAEVREAINEEDLLSLGGAYGNKNVGDPVEYDHLKLVLAGDVVEITVFNRGITLFTSDDERVRRIHRVLCDLNWE
ncbi:MAG: hypothetical protein JRE40_12605 [Deltaproteobacteria bacterium]|nr:hypothetical protein [Deltaproteobacteria bacterium]MBW2595326.1 hypothetical protein [Deltaproteobacteria bacterium]